ncbi:MAG: cyclodeaminase/cyclohydrolase family protein [Ferrimicrobium sp.]
MKLSDSVNAQRYLNLTLESFFELVSEPKPAPAGGSVAAVAVALAAALCVKAAHLSKKQMSGASDIAIATEQLRDRAATLCQADADVYGSVVSARRGHLESDPGDLRPGLAEALSRASDAPFEIVEIAVRVAAMASQIVENGNPNLIGDAVTATLLADSGARSAAALVLINLEGIQGDERRSRVITLLRDTAESADRAWSARLRSSS